MSMTDEGTRPSNQPAATQSREKSSSDPKGAGRNGGSLPGLAAFGQMQGYTPVSNPEQRQSDTPEPSHQDSYSDTPEPSHQDSYEDTPSLEAESQDFANQFAQEFEQQYAPDNGPEPKIYSGAADESLYDEEVDGGAFSDDDRRSYMAEQHASFDSALQQPEASAYDAGPALQPNSRSHSEYASYEGDNALKPFEAHYDQHPEIPLGIFDEPGADQGDQPFFHEHGQQADADFLGGEVANEAEAPKERKERKGRKVLMAVSGLIGVLALGGALAFAYKIGGESDIARTGQPPLIQADSRPVKVAPEEPGGKQFPHANRKIYERLGGEKSEEVVKIKPRQEDVAAAATAAIRGTEQSSTGEAPGGPRKVKTLTVRPDGTIEAPAAAPVSAPVTTAPDGTVAMSFPTPSSPKPEQPAAPESKQTKVTAPPPPVAPTIPQATAAASEAPAVAAPPPVQKPPVPRTAAPAAATAAAGSYVVQVAARRSQTDALAAFADIQQKYPRLLDGYRPIIKRADLGDKGVWYRLNVGPVESENVASALCGQLKSAGMKSCLVRSQ
jgi:hypothetical protein